MKQIEQDILFLEEGISQMEGYLLSAELYWPLSGSLPRLTPGALLLSLLRVSAVSPADATRLQARLDVVKSTWRSAWEKKATREVSNRLRLWSQYLSDYLQSADKNSETYRAEVRGRVIIQLLLREQPDLPETKNLAELDLTLIHYIKPGNFLWEGALEPVFDKKEFWFLYGSL